MKPLAAVVAEQLHTFHFLTVLARSEKFTAFRFHLRKPTYISTACESGGLKDLSYTLTKVDNVTFTGLNDDWSEHPMQQSSDNPEVFTAEFVKEKETPWGVKVLINNNWSLFFGGNLHQHRVRIRWLFLCLYHPVEDW